MTASVYEPTVDVVTVMEDFIQNTSLLEDTVTAPMSNLTQRPAYGYGCGSGWRQENHVVFQIANVCVLLGFASPNTLMGNMVLHGMLMLGFLLESAWSWMVLCAPDIFSWNFSFMVVNLIQTLYILYQLKPIKFSPELEDVYVQIFEPLKVPRSLFKKLTSSAYSSVNSLHVGEAYAIQNVTRADKLGLLISGSASVYCKQQFLHSIGPMEFLDSPEFDAVTTADEKYQASIMATDPCRYILWSRSNLAYLLVKEAYLSHIIGTLVARDITNKLYVLNDKALGVRGYRQDIRLPAVTSFLSGVPTKHSVTDQCKSPQTVTDTISEAGSSMTGLSEATPHNQTSVSNFTFPANGTAVQHPHQPTSVSNDDFSRLGRWDSKTILV